VHTYHNSKVLFRSFILGAKEEDDQSLGGRTKDIIEAFILKGLNRTVIAKHAIKIFDYDPSGLGRNILLVYAEAENFGKLWKEYLAYLPGITYPHRLLANPEEMDTGLANIRLASTRHDRHGKQTILYHLFIDMRARYPGQ